MPLPLIEIPGAPRLTSLPAAIRREILSVLAGCDTVTVPSATAQIAASWSARRRRRGASPSDVRTAVEIVFQVGADLVDEVPAQPAPDRRPAQQSEILGERRTLVRIPRAAA